MRSDNPMDYEFPEIEEYFIYNPKTAYPTSNPTQTGANNGIKMSKIPLHTALQVL
jgi:hypothetical protein